LLGWDLDADGSAEDLLYAEIGGNIHMDGKEVFRRAVRIMVDSAQKSMQVAGVTADDIALIVPHQANTRIISAACERLGIPMERTSTVLHETGNTSSASIPSSTTPTSPSTGAMTSPWDRTSAARVRSSNGAREP
jgi:3-oxoacyl-[acyl-carrier-protein] synthase-3